MNQVEDGFCFSVRLVDGKSTKMFVNVLGHPQLGLPLTKSGNAVTEQQLDALGLDNLQIPIDVLPLVREPSDKDPSTEVLFAEVVVSNKLSQRCDLTRPASKLFTSRLVPLALQWIRQECGVRGDPTTVKFFENARRKLSRKAQSELAVHSKAEHLYQTIVKKQETRDEEVAAEAARLPDEFNLKKKSSSKGPEPAPNSTERPAQRKPLIVELDGQGAERKEPVVRKGFLNDENRRPLYGPEGTKEGVLPDGAGDPLGHLPKSLREKCRVVDCTKLEEGKPTIQAPNPQASRSNDAPKSTPLVPAKPNSMISSSSAVSEPSRGAPEDPVKITSASPAVGSAEDIDSDDEFVRRSREVTARRKAGKCDPSASFDFFGDRSGVPSIVPEASRPPTSSTHTPPDRLDPKEPREAAAVSSARVPAQSSPPVMTNGITIVSSSTDSAVDGALEELGFVPAKKWKHVVCPRDDQLSVEVTLPSRIQSASMLEINVEANTIEILEVGMSSGSALAIALPRTVDPQSATVKLIRKSSTLRITIPHSSNNP